MIEDPDRWAPEYAKLGAASISFHMGATHAPVRLARQLRDMGCKACFAVRPAEPVEPIFDILDEFDMVLIMTVEPGFGGQKFLDNQMAKVRRLRDEITRRGLSTHIQVDGGVSPKTPTSSPRPAPTCWSPAPPCTALRARPRPSTRSGTRPLPHTATDGGNAEHGRRRLRHQCRTAIAATPSSASTMHNLKGHIS